VDLEEDGAVVIAAAVEVPLPEADAVVHEVCFYHLCSSLETLNRTRFQTRLQLRLPWVRCAVSNWLLNWKLLGSFNGAKETELRADNCRWVRE